MIYKFKRGATDKHSKYVGPVDTLSIDTTTGLLYVHDGETPGGLPAGGIEYPPAPTDEGIFALTKGKWVKVDLNPGEPDLATAIDLPGPDDLIGGDESAGFYGEVPASEFIDADELAMAVGYSGGTSFNTPNNYNSPWLKFAYKGKTLFIPKHPIKKEVTWDSLYESGLVYGVDDYGPYHSGNPTNQLNIVTISGSEFLVRLPQGANTQIVPADSIGWDIDVTHDSEWNDLLYHVHDGQHRNTNNSMDSEGIIEGDWALYSDSDLSVHYYPSSFNIDGSSTLCQEVNSFNGELARVIRGEHGISRISRISKASTSATIGWRPVLELIS